MGFLEIFGERFLTEFQEIIMGKLLGSFLEECSKGLMGDESQRDLQTNPGKTPKRILGFLDSRGNFLKKNMEGFLKHAWRVVLKNKQEFLENFLGKFLEVFLEQTLGDSLWITGDILERFSGCISGFQERFLEKYDSSGGRGAIFERIPPSISRRITRRILEKILI